MSTSEKHEKIKKKKLPSTAWKSGQSGNPKGRPKSDYSVSEQAREVLSEVNVYDADGRSIRYGILKKMATEALGGNVYAATWLFDRAYGKVPDKIITHEDTDGLIVDIE